MRTFILALGFILAPALAFAETITPADAPKYVGKSVTVEGLVSDVHHAASGKVTFIDMGGRYPDNAVAGVIFSGDAGKFPDVDSLNGKTVDLIGTIKLHQDRTEIILNNPSQIKAK